jgi:CDP-glucose 4,6-dehydratase
MESVGLNSRFWSGKKVLITGHAGFKGSWLSLWLEALGAELIGYSIGVPTVPSLYELAHVADDMTAIKGDVRDLDHLKVVMVKHKPEIVIHMAAQSLVRLSYEDPIETYSTNIMGTVNVLEAVNCSDSVHALLVITSDKCYENQDWVWGYRETDPMGGHDPYSSSKGCAELVTSAYIRSFFSKKQSHTIPVFVASTRAGNVIGGGDWAQDRLVPDIMRAILSKEAVVVRYPKAIRPWQHVLEPLRGYLILAEKLWYEGNDFVGAWNFGPNDHDARPVSMVTEALTNLWGNNASWKTDSIEHPYEAKYLKLDCSKARSLLRWYPMLNIDQSLVWIVEWYRAFSRGEDMRKVTQDQIARYEAIVNGGAEERLVGGI